MTDTEQDYYYSTVEIELHPGPDADMDEIHEDADWFAEKMAKNHNVMAQVVREERGNYKPNRDES